MNYRHTGTQERPGKLAGLVRSLPLLALTLFVFGANAPLAYAGFGITPPYVQNQRLSRGSSFDQRITLVRSDAKDDLKVQITSNLQGFESWVTIDRGTEFIMPAGATQLPIIITVKVPQDADYKDYKGAIRIRTSSANTGAGGVSIALGAQIDVALKVVDKIQDFDVRRIRIVDLEEGHRKWSLFFPGKIRFFMTIENTGNVPYGPTRVHMDIYDSDEAKLLESTDNTNTIEQAAPFTVKEVLAELPTHLSAGRYLAKYTIFKGADIAQQNELTLSISSQGAVPGYEGYGFEGLSLADKLKVVFAVAVPLVLIAVLVVALIMRRRRARERTYGYQAR
jgi:hypothetical protein